MYKVKFDTGEIVTFQNQPTDSDIEDVVKKLGIKPKNALIPDTSKTTKEITNSNSTLQDIGVGLAQSIVKPVQNIGKLITEPIRKVLGGSIETGLPSEQLQPKNTTQKVGNVVGDIVQFAIPGSKVAKATKSLPFLTKLLASSATSGAIATAQQGEIGSGTAIAAGTEALLPVVGKVLKPVINVGTRLVKSLASGLSGSSSKALESIISEPYVSKQIAKNIDLTGQENILQKNTETIVNGISKVRQEARVAYGQAIGDLKSTDINPQQFRANIVPVLTDIGSVVKNGKRIFQNIEFSDIKNIKKALNLINKLLMTPLDGYSLRNLLNTVDNSAYKIATTDERLSFNAFIRKLSDGIKNSISQSTDKLNEINKAYSSDLQLTGAMESIFGKVKFKNVAEINRVSQKLENLFSQKGLSPVYVDKFLTRIGIKPSEFKASEAVRQISNTANKSNEQGTSISEIFRGLTSSVVTPKAVRNLAIMTGLTEQALTLVLQKLNPTARGALIELLTQFKND